MTDTALTQFSAAQFAELPVPTVPPCAPPDRQSLETYLGQSQRVVKTMAQGAQWEALGDQRFRLALRSLSIFGLTFEPTVDLKVWLDGDGVLRLRSLGCELVGIDYLNQKFSLQLFGRLRVVEQEGQLYLKGVADLGVRLILPAPISYLPETVIQPAGNSLLDSVLKTIHQRLCEHLIADYQEWVQQTALQDVA